MKKHLGRTIIIYLVVLWALINIYPTVGWMMLSEETRTARLNKWTEEDKVYQEPNYFKSLKKSVSRWAQCDRSKVINLGLDLQGGIHMVLSFDMTQEMKDKGFDTKSVQEIVLQRIERRVNDFEAKEPLIQSMGDNMVQIQLPGEKNVERAKNLIMKTAFLTFHKVAGSDETNKVFQDIKKNFENKFTPFLKAPVARNTPYRVPVEHIRKVMDVVKEAEAKGGVIPADKMVGFSPPPKPSQEQEYKIYVLDKEPLMTGEGLKLAVARPDQDNPGNWQILFQNNAEAAKKCGEVTEANLHKAMAIVLDGVVCSAPTIQSRITSNGQITGDFDAAEANDLAIALNSGAMPVPVKEEYTGVVGATLGADSIRNGVLSSVLGLLAVVVFMIVYYHIGGVIANVALVLNAIILAAMFAYFGLTLTLPGIAGFVLTLGMAVDANVLIFERLREELRNGKSLLAALDAAYERATATILDANITTLIAALVLLQFGTGPVKGFGVALALGILTSVFTALVVTKAIFDFIMARKPLKSLTMLSIIPQGTKIDFMGLRNKFFIFSGVILGVGMIVFLIRGDANYGVDFASGMNMTVKLDSANKVNIADVRSAIEKGGFNGPMVQESGDASGDLASANTFMVRTADFEQKAADVKTEEVKSDVQSRVKAALAPLVGGDVSKVVLDRVEAVGPAIGEQLRRDAFLAMFYAFVFMLAYMWFRYNLIFGVTALIALLHDPLAALSSIATSFTFTIDMNVIAAILTLIGYSINDTIVVYDRIRENLKHYQGRGLSLGEIMNLAINQTLSRTILTSVVTLLTVIVLFFFGGDVLRSFAFVLGIGIVVGTYSSIFIASALAYVIMEYRRKKQLAGQVQSGKGGPVAPGASRRKPAPKAKTAKDSKETESEA